MSTSFQVGNSVTAAPSHPIKGDGTPSSAVLTNPILSSSDANVFTIIPDPNNPNGAIIVSQNPGVATISGTVTAARADGTLYTIPIAADTITITAAPPPPEADAVSVGLVYGVPFATPSAS